MKFSGDNEAYLKVALEHFQLHSGVSVLLLSDGLEAHPNLFFSSNWQPGRSISSTLMPGTNTTYSKVTSLLVT